MVLEAGLQSPADRYDVLWQPAKGWVGDVVPFFHDGWFWLYYLHDWRGVEARPAATSWHLVRTRDLLTWEDLGEVLPHGGPEAQDRNCYTGSVVAADDGFHAFYTGYNPSILDADGLPLQAVMHAVSPDLVHWTKRPDDTFHAPAGRLERHDWRDPFVFRDPEVPGRWLMLLAARETSGLSRRRGCTALCSSEDLVSWRVEEPFWSPGLFLTHECPEVFELGGRWYFTFSEFSERFTARYRIGASAHGPWRRPLDDTLDGRAWYAPRTASDGRSRFAFGWIPTREGDTDDGPWQWAGTMAVHELTGRRDGSLRVSLPAPIRASFSEALAADMDPVAGEWRSTAAGMTGTSDGFALAAAGPLPRTCLLTADITMEPGSRGAGVAVRLGDDADHAYYVRLEPAERRLVFDRWPRRAPGHHQWMIAGDVPHAVELERMVALEPGVPHRLEILIDGSALIAYLDGSVAMSARIHDRPQAGWGVFISEGTATFTDLSVRIRPAHQE